MGKNPFRMLGSYIGAVSLGLMTFFSDMFLFLKTIILPIRWVVNKIPYQCTSETIGCTVGDAIMHFIYTIIFSMIIGFFIGWAIQSLIKRLMV